MPEWLVKLLGVTVPHMETQEVLRRANEDWERERALRAREARMLQLYDIPNQQPLGPGFVGPPAPVRPWQPGPGPGVGPGLLSPSGMVRG